MTYEELKQIIAGDEHRTLELKKSTGELKEGMHTACAFLNTDGGWLIFGVTPTSLKILGQQVNDTTQREIAQALSFMEPQINATTEYIDVPERNGDKVIAIFFDGWVWGKDPYTYHGRPYYKVESTTKEMPRQMFEERLKAAKPQYYAWERKQADSIEVKDLNESRIRGAIRLGVEGGRMPSSAITESLPTLLEKMKLMKDGKPNNAAAMLFCSNTYEYPQFKIRMARFRGTDKNAFIDNQQAEGNFFDLLDAGMAFCFKWLALSGEIKGVMREEHLEIPVIALRETLINALCHRHLEEYNLTIGLAVYDDRVEIENPGELPPQLTPETIKNPHKSYPYNPIIADVLYKTTFLENWGSGVRRIVDACKAQGMEEPTWKNQEGFTVVTFLRPNKTVASTNVTNNGTQSEGNGTQNGTQSEGNGTQNGTQSEGNDTQSEGNDTQNKVNDTQNEGNDTQNGTQSEGNDTQKVARRRTQIGRLIGEDAHISTSVIAGKVGSSARTVKRDLKEMGYTWVGHPKTGRWIVQRDDNNTI